MHGESAPFFAGRHFFRLIEFPVGSLQPNNENVINYEREVGEGWNRGRSHRKCVAIDALRTDRQKKKRNKGRGKKNERKRGELVSDLVRDKREKGRERERERERACPHRIVNDRGTKLPGRFAKVRSG